MNARILRSNFFESARIGKLDAYEKLLLIGLLARADDRGNGTVNILQIMVYVFTNDADITQGSIPEMIKKLHKHGFICLYNAGEYQYYHVIGWRDKGSAVFQKLIHVRPDTEIPICPGFEDDQYLGKKDTIIDESGNVSDTDEYHIGPDSVPNGVAKKDNRNRNEINPCQMEGSLVGQYGNIFQYISEDFIIEVVSETGNDLLDVIEVLKRFNKYIENNPGKVKRYEYNFLKWCSEDLNEFDVDIY